MQSLSYCLLYIDVYRPIYVHIYFPDVKKGDNNNMEKQIFWWYCIRNNNNNNNNTTVMEGSAKATSVQTEVGKWMYLSPGCKIWSNHTILANYGIHLLVICILDCIAICLNTIHLVISHYQWKFLPFLNVMSTVSYTCRIDFPAKKKKNFPLF